MEEPRVISSATYSRWIAVLITMCLIGATSYALQHTLSCFLFSWVFAYLLDPFLVCAEKRGIKRLYGLILLYFLLAVLSIFFLAFMLPKLTISWNSILVESPGYIQKLKQFMGGLKSEIPNNYGSEEIQWLLDKISANIDAAVENAGAWLYVFATRIFLNLFNIVLSPVLVFFMLFYKQTIMDTIASWLPKSRRTIMLTIGREVNSSIGGYLRGQVAISIIVAILSLIALLIFNVPHPILCSLFAGGASVLPFIGVFLATIPALFFAWFKYQAAAILIKIGIAFGIIYFLEGYIIKPLVFKESMNLNPLLTIIMVMAMGELLGLWGILLAIPITAAMKITWGHFQSGAFRT